MPGAPLTGGSQQQQQYALGSMNLPASAPTAPSSALRRRAASFAETLPETSINSICGAVAGAASGIVTCPLDVIKTRLQVQGGFRPRGVPRVATAIHPYSGLVGTAKTIWQQDGLRGMYRGLGPMLFGYLPTWAVYMGVYGGSRDFYYTQIDNKVLAQIAASVTAGCSSTLVTNPIWVVKTRLMSQVSDTAPKETRSPWKYNNTLDAFKKMYATEGIGVFYSGLTPALLGLTHVAIQFPLYEYFKKKFTGLEMGEHSEHDSHWAGILGATFLSKVCATCATYPHEVLRTRLQTQQRHSRITPRSQAPTRVPDAAQNGSGRPMPPQPKTELMAPRYSGIVKSCEKILQEEGWRAFYYGMGTNLFRAIPAAMTTMLTYESLKRFVQTLQEEGRGARRNE